MSQELVAANVNLADIMGVSLVELQNIIRDKGLPEHTIARLKDYGLTNEQIAALELDLLSVSFADVQTYVNPNGSLRAFDVESLYSIGVVPESSTFALFVVGALLLGARRFHGRGIVQANIY